MPDNLPPGVFATVIGLQVLVAIGLGLLAVRIVGAIHAQGRSILPSKLTAKVKKWFGGAGS